MIELTNMSPVSQNMNHLAWENTMRTLDLCFESWEEEIKASGKREVRSDKIVQLTLKVRAGASPWSMRVS